MLITFYRGLYDTIPKSAEDLTWSEFLNRIAVSIEAASKFYVPGFGAHRLTGTGPLMRCAEHATVITLCAFDVDAGTPTQVAECEALIRADGLAAHFYTSHSHAPEKPAYRLLIPITRDLSPTEYAAVRAHLIQRCRVPCKPEQCADVSRFWFVPSHPPGRVPIAITLEGRPFDVDTVAFAAYVPTPRRSKPTFVPPPEPVGPVDLSPLEAKIRAKATRLLKRPSATEQSRGAALKKLLNHESLADEGARNETTLRVAGTVAFLLPGTPLSSFLLLFRPSLLAMQAAGSKLTEETLTRMLLTAMEKRHAASIDLTEFRREVVAYRDALDLSIKPQGNK